MAQLKMGAGNAGAAKDSRWLLDVRQSQTPCCGRREAKQQMLFVACGDQELVATPRTETRDVCEWCSC